jgi:hypothetical protein
VSEPVQALEQKARPGESPPTDPAAAIEPALNATHWIVCATCAQPITTASQRLSVSGRHLHEFMNPDGQRFVVACFSGASGLLGGGEPSTVWTWFPGYTWQIALCQGCTTHLGWIYRSQSELFYGLIWDRLAELSAPGAAS